MLPPDESFLSGLEPADVDGPLNLREKEIILAALRFYFGPAQEWGTVRDVTDVNSLNELNVGLREPGRRYQMLEQQTGLPAGYFAASHPATSEVKLYAIKQDNPGRAPSHHLYEAHHTLTLYIGPDFFHERPDVVVINTLVLDVQHRPVESHTLRLGTHDEFEIL
jgi:hypothetical protein